MRRWMLFMRDARGRKSLTGLDPRLMRLRERHEPTPPAWGFDNGGARTLGYMVLWQWFGRAVAERFFEPFSAEVIATLDIEAAYVRERAVAGWLFGKGWEGP